jgi:hypothetical protein
MLFWRRYESLSLRQFLELAKVVFSSGHKEVGASIAPNAANTSNAFDFVTRADTTRESMAMADVICP